MFFPNSSDEEEREEPLQSEDILNELTMLYNQDFLCRKRQRWPLLTLNREKIDALLNSENSREKLSSRCLKEAMALCALYPDELFFAGGFILHCLDFRQEHNPYSPPDVDFFVVSNSEERAITIIQECVELLRGKAKKRPNYIIRSESALTYLESKHPEDNFPSTFSQALAKHRMKFQFIHRLYSHPSQIVGMFDLFPCGVLYSHREGFLSTPLAQYCIEKKCIFVDPTRISTTFSNRLSKYLRRGFHLWIPNHVSGTLLVKDDSYDLQQMVKNPASIFAYKGWVFNTHGPNWVPVPKHEEADYQECDTCAEDFIKSLYFHVPLTMNMPMLVTGDDYLVDVERLLEIQDTTNNDLFPSPTGRVTVDLLKSVFEGDELREVSEAVFFGDNAQEAWQVIGERLVLRRQEDLKKHFRPYREGGFFRIANPGQQGGGSFNPTVKSGSDFWDGKNTFPIEVGLSHEVYWLLKQICFENSAGIYLSKDLFHLLCMWCVMAQTH